MINIFYEELDKTLHTNKLESIKNKTFFEIIDSIGDGFSKNAKCWIYANKTDTWIECLNEYMLDLLVMGLKSDDQEIIDIVFKENNFSPNSKIISNCSLKSNSSIILNSIEPFTFENIELLDKKDLVLIPSSQNMNSYYLIDSLSIIPFIKIELSNGKRFFEISLDIDNETVVFDRKIWMNYLLRSHENYKILLNFFTDIFYNSSESSNELKKLNDNKDLLKRLKFFLNDLLVFNDERLDFYSSSNTNYYFSLFYFTEDEIDYLVNFPTSSGLKYKDLFDLFIGSKKEDYNLCTSHDIAPFIYKVFGISKNFNKFQDFNTSYRRFKGLIFESK